MSKELEDAQRGAEEFAARLETEVPLAARIPAEPGWRVVTFQYEPVPGEQGAIKLQIRVEAIKEWGVAAWPSPTPGDPFSEPMLLDGPLLWPMNLDGTRIKASCLFRILPPSVVTPDEVVLAEAVDKIRSLVASHTPAPQSNPD